MEGKLELILYILVAYVLFVLVPHDTTMIYMSSVPTVLLGLPRATLETMTGNMLGDGSVGYPNFARDGKASGNARYAITMSAKAYNYLLSLANGVYSKFSTYVLKPYPNLYLPQHEGKTVTQYYFQTRSLPIFTALHSL